MRAVLTLITALPAVALAQPSEIVVTGRGPGEAAGDKAYAVTTIDADRLRNSADGRVESVLRDVAGLQQFRRSDARSANPTSQGVTLRGLGGNASGRVLVLLDGVPQGDPFAGYVSWPLYLPERLERVRVTRGGGSGANGSGALAGTIELESIGVGAAPVTATLAGGSFASVDARTVVAGPLGSGFAFVAGGHAQADGFIPVVAEQRGAADVGTRYAQASLAGRASFPVGSGELQAGFALFDDRRTRGTAFSANATTGADASVRLVGRQVTALGYVQLRRFTSQFASVDPARGRAALTLDQYDTPATGLGATVEARPRLGALALRLGGEWRHTSGQTEEAFLFVSGAPTRLRQAGGRSDIVGAFGEATLATDALTLTGGVRLDRWWLSGGQLSERRIGGGTITDLRFVERSGTETTARLGVNQVIYPTLNLRAAAAIGWRLPTLNELYRPFRVGNEATAANAALVPERSTGFELGLDWNPAPAVRLSATAFATRLSKAIANITLTSTAAATQRERRNLDAIMAQGVELDAEVKTGDWSGRVSGSLTRSRVRGTGVAAALDGLSPAQVAPLQVSGTLGWRWMSATARYVSAQFDDDQNIRRLAPALTADLVAALPLSRAFTIQLRVENIADTAVEAARSAAGIVERAAPRTFWAALRWTG